MLPTPRTSHIDPSRIYEPAEDSFLLLDTLSSPSQTTYLQTHFPPSAPSPLILEIGSGSGVVIAFLAAHARTILGRADVLLLAGDVNGFACGATGRTVERAVREQEEQEQEQCGKGGTGIFAGCVQGDLTAPLRSGSVDILVFNPPYVPTENLPSLSLTWEEEAAEPGSSSARFARDAHLLSLSYAGGTDGMQTTSRLLAQLPDILSARGVAYVLLCAQNRLDTVVAGIRAWPGGWEADVVGDSGGKAGWERLKILRIARGE